MKKITLKPGFGNYRDTLDLKEYINQVLNENGFPILSSCCILKPILSSGQSLTWNGTSWVPTTPPTPVIKGTTTLVAGTKVVNNTSITASSNIQLTINTPGGTVGNVYVSSRINGTSFTITSSSNLDTSVIGYVIYN